MMRSSPARAGRARTSGTARVFLVAALALLGLAWLGSDTARATFPGENGMIAFGRDNTIRVVNPDGGAETFLTCDLREVMAQNPVARDDPHSTWGPVWSPDGRRIVFRREIPGGGPAAGVDTSLFTLDPNGSERRIGGGTPAWSPDGERIAVASGEQYDFWADAVSPSSLWVVNRDGSDRTRLAEGGSQPSWSPDGERLAFVLMRDTADFEAPRDVWAMNADGSDQTLLAERAVSPAWSPDGWRIAFMRDSDVWAMNADGSDQTLLAERAISTAWSPAWSPDGRRIAFARSGEGPAGFPSNFEIWVMNADGSDARRLVTGIWDGTWSPDGQKVAFSREGAIWVMNADGSKQARVTERPGHSGIDWQPIPPGTDGNPGPSQFCFTRLRRNTNRGIARLVVEVSGPGRVILRQQAGVRRFAQAHREAGPGRVVLRVRPRGWAERKLSRAGRTERRVQLPVRAQVTYRPWEGVPRTRGGRVWLVKR